MFSVCLSVCVIKDLNVSNKKLILIREIYRGVNTRRHCQSNYKKRCYKNCIPPSLSSALVKIFVKNNNNNNNPNFFKNCFLTSLQKCQLVILNTLSPVWSSTVKDRLFRENISMNVSTWHLKAYAVSWEWELLVEIFSIWEKSD